MEMNSSNLQTCSSVTVALKIFVLKALPLNFLQKAFPDSIDLLKYPCLSCSPRWWLFAIICSLSSLLSLLSSGIVFVLITFMSSLPAMEPSPGRHIINTCQMNKPMLNIYMGHNTLKRHNHILWELTVLYFVQLK